MKRRLFNVLAGASVLRCVALFLDDAFWHPTLILPAPPPTTMVVTESGGIETFNYHVTSVSVVHTYPFFGIRIRFGIAVFLAAVLPACWVINKLINIFAGPRKPGLCHVCGYDLRAAPDRCPECGTVPNNIGAGK